MMTWVNSINNQLKPCIFDNPIMIKIYIITVIQHTNDHDLMSFSNQICLSTVVLRPHNHMPQQVDDKTIGLNKLVTKYTSQ